MVLCADIVEDSLSFLREKVLKWGERLSLSCYSYSLWVVVRPADRGIIFVGGGGRLDLSDCPAS